MNGHCVDGYANSYLRTAALREARRRRRPNRGAEPCINLADEDANGATIWHGHVAPAWVWQVRRARSDDLWNSLDVRGADGITLLISSSSAYRFHNSSSVGLILPSAANAMNVIFDCAVNLARKGRQMDRAHLALHRRMVGY